MKGNMNGRHREQNSPVPEEIQGTRLRLTCPPCGEVFTADDEDTLITMAVEHARKLHDMNLLEHYRPDEFRALVRRENETYWARIAHLIPDGQVKSVLHEKLCDREREIVSYVVHGFPNREIAERLCISDRTVSTHLVNIYQKLDVHSRAELAAIVRATDRIVEAAVRGDTTQEYGRSCIRTAGSLDNCWRERGAWPPPCSMQMRNADVQCKRSM